MTDQAIAIPLTNVNENEHKRDGIVNQLVTQGQTLAYEQTFDLILTIKKMAAEHELDRGLSIYLPYFDDQVMGMKTYHLEVIPYGRVMFVPAFVVLAARKEQMIITNNTHLSPMTKNQLMVGLKLIMQAFE